MAENKKTSYGLVSKQVKQKGKIIEKSSLLQKELRQAGLSLARLWFNKLSFNTKEKQQTPFFTQTMNSYL